jgi:hypothetical protein
MEGSPRGEPGCWEAQTWEADTLPAELLPLGSAWAEALPRESTTTRRQCETDIETANGSWEVLRKLAGA